MSTSSTVEINHLSHSSGTHTHDHHQLLFALDGTTDCEMEGRGGVIFTTMACIVPATQTHHYAGAQQQNDLLVINIPIDNDITSLLDKTANDIDRIFDCPRFIAVDPWLTQAVQQGACELTFSHINPLSSLQLTINLVAMLYQRLLNTATDHYGKSEISINKINLLIDEQLSKSLSVTEMARHMHISESHFYALFQQQFKMSPHQYVLHRRMEWAKYFLNAKLMSITDIAHELGFSGAASFSRAFKRCEGVAPSKLQKLACHPFP